MSFTADSSRPSSEINVTPLIDVLLVLLIIFMVIVPVTPHGLESSLPRQAGPSAPLPPVQVRLSVGDAIVPVRYSVGAEQINYADVQPRLRALFAARQDRTLIVAADRNLSFQQVAAVVAEGRLAGAGAVVLRGLDPSTEP
jgi:biopolymer transport protein ExbD